MRANLKPLRIDNSQWNIPEILLLGVINSSTPKWEMLRPADLDRMFTNALDLAWGLSSRGGVWRSYERNRRRILRATAGEIVRKRSDLAGAAERTIQAMLLDGMKVRPALLAIRA